MTNLNHYFQAICLPIIRSNAVFQSSGLCSSLQGQTGPLNEFSSGLGTRDSPEESSLVRQIRFADKLGRDIEVWSLRMQGSDITAYWKVFRTEVKG